MTSSRVWFITGCSRGFGREWATAALDRGDRVAATARDVTALAEFTDAYGDRIFPLQLDVTDRAADFRAVAQAHSHFGHLDVVVNNAGYGQFGMVEEVSEAEARDQMETNLFGALWVTQATIPFLRAQGSGHIIQVSSIGGLSAFPNYGIYHASKWALEGISQSLAAEVAQFGIKVTLVEPSGYATDWGRSSARHARPLSEYDAYRSELAAIRRERRAQAGEPLATRAAILKLVDSPEPPLRMLLGDGPLEVVTRDYEQRLRTWHEWADVSVAAHRSGPTKTRPANIVEG